MNIYYVVFDIRHREYSLRQWETFAVMNIHYVVRDIHVMNIHYVVGDIRRYE